MSYLIKQLDLALRAQIEPIAQRFDVTAPQYAALTLVQKYPGISSAQLGRKSFVTAQAANEVVSSLERKGLIERTADASNHRIRNILLSNKGTAALKNCNQAIDQVEALMITRLGRTSPEALRKSLQSLLQTLTPAEE